MQTDQHHAVMGDGDAHEIMRFPHFSDYLVFLFKEFEPPRYDFFYRKAAKSFRQDGQDGQDCFFCKTFANRPEGALMVSYAITLLITAHIYYGPQSSTKSLTSHFLQQAPDNLLSLLLTRYCIPYSHI